MSPSCDRCATCAGRLNNFIVKRKQLTGLEKCQCRLARIVRNHIAAAFLVWVHLMRKAHETGQTLYQVKHGLLSEYLSQQLKSPMLKIAALEGLRAALTPLKKPSTASRPKKFDGEKEAHLIALACSQAPEGHSRWTLRLLAEKMVELNHFSSISHEAIRRVVKKTNSDRG